MQEGDVIDGRYRVDQKLGQGGMGQVFRGHDHVLNKTVAIKVLFPNTPDLVIKRFHAEAVALGQLKHPNILSVQHFGQSEDGVLYLVTDFIEGESLSAMIENRGAQTFFDMLPIFERICRGLRYAHANNVLHRDIKPSNVMLETDRSTDASVKLVDFGLAKQADKDFDLTKIGSAMGTPGYMSPEAIQGKEADARTDIYALGCTFFEMMTGRLPFVEETAFKTMMAQIKLLPPTLSEVSGRTFDPDVEAFIQKCLKKDPNERFHDMDELTAELKSLKEKLHEKEEADKILGSGIFASGLLLVNKMKRADRFLTKGSILLLLIAGAVVVASGALVWWHPTKTESPKTDRALSDLATEAQKIQNQEDLETMQVDGVPSGVTIETGSNGEKWCCVFGTLTDEQLHEKLKPYKDVPNYLLEDLSVSAKALDGILDLPIEKLTLKKFKLTDNLAQRVAKMKHLNWLETLNCGALPADFLRYFRDSHLTTIILDMGESQMHPGSDLASIKTLQKITLAHGRIYRSDIRSIVSALDLKSLNLKACTLPEDALVDMKLAKNCIAFTATEVNLTTLQFEDISKIPSLRYLNLSLTNMDNKALKFFHRCNNLQKLTLVRTSVTPTGIAVLKASVPNAQALLTVSNDDPY